MADGVPLEAAMPGTEAPCPEGRRFELLRAPTAPRPGASVPDKARVSALTGLAPGIGCAVTGEDRRGARRARSSASPGIGMAEGTPLGAAMPGMEAPCAEGRRFELLIIPTAPRPGASAASDGDEGAPPCSPEGLRPPGFKPGGTPPGACANISLARRVRYASSGKEAGSPPPNPSAGSPPFTPWGESPGEKVSAVDMVVIQCDVLESP